MSRTVETQFTRVTLRDDGIVVARTINRDSQRSGDAVANHLEQIRELIGESPRPAMWDARDSQGAPADALKAAVERLPSLASALAIVTTPGSRSPLGSFTSVMDSLILPVRLFDSEGEAIEWLLQNEF